MTKSKHLMGSIVTDDTVSCRTLLNPCIIPDYSQKILGIDEERSRIGDPCRTLNNHHHWKMVRCRDWGIMSIFSLLARDNMENVKLTTIQVRCFHVASSKSCLGYLLDEKNRGFIWFLRTAENGGVCQYEDLYIKKHVRPIHARTMHAPLVYARLMTEQSYSAGETF